MNISFLIVLANTTVPLPLQTREVFPARLELATFRVGSGRETTLRKPQRMHEVELLDMTYIYVLVHWY